MCAIHDSDTPEGHHSGVNSNPSDSDSPDGVSNMDMDIDENDRLLVEISVCDDAAMSAFKIERSASPLALDSTDHGVWPLQSHDFFDSVMLSPPAERDTPPDGFPGPSTPDLVALSPRYSTHFLTPPLDEEGSLSPFVRGPKTEFIAPLVLHQNHENDPEAEPDDTIQIYPGQVKMSPLTRQQSTKTKKIHRNGRKTGSNANKHTESLYSKPRQHRRPGSARRRVGRPPTLTDRLEISPTCGNPSKDSARKPYICVFHYAGCTQSFGAKNEWKRHVSTKHLGRYYWHCTLASCLKAHTPIAHGPVAPCGIPSHGSINNRKDLYTQHVLRMHFNVHKADQLSMEDAERLRSLQESSQHKRCDPPTFMECPAAGCIKSFHGPGAWDERMEHVADHLERAADGKEPGVHFGGDHDLTMTQWVESPDAGVVVRVPGGWRCCDPLKGGFLVMK